MKQNVTPTLRAESPRGVVDLPVEANRAGVIPEGLQFPSERSSERLFKRLILLCAAGGKIEIPEEFFQEARGAVALSNLLAQEIVSAPQSQASTLLRLEGRLEQMLTIISSSGESLLRELREAVQDTLLFVRSRCSSVVIAWMPELLSRVATEAEAVGIASVCSEENLPEALRYHRASRESKMAMRIFAAQNREGAFDRLVGRMERLVKMIPEGASIASLKLVSDAASQARAVFAGPKTEEEGLLVDTPDARFERAFKLFLKILPNADRDGIGKDMPIPLERVMAAAELLDLIRLEHEWELWNTPDAFHYTPEQIDRFVLAHRGQSLDRSHDPRLAMRDDDIKFPWVARITELLDDAPVDRLIASGDLKRELERHSEKLRERARLHMPAAEPLRVFQYNPGCEIFAPETVVDDVCRLQEQWSLKRRQTPNTPVIAEPFSYDDLVRRMRLNKEVYIVARVGDDTLGVYLLFVNDDRFPWSGHEIKRMVGKRDNSATMYADEVIKERKENYPGIYPLLDLSMEAAARVHAIGHPVKLVGLVEPANKQIMRSHEKYGWGETGYDIISPEGLRFHIIERPVAAVSDRKGE